VSNGRTRLSLSLDGRASDRPRAARRWVADRCAELRLDIDGPDLTLLVSELVTNACVHGAEPIHVRLDVDHGRVRVEVEDGSPMMPEVQRPDGRSTIGRGLLIVEALSRAWGAEPVGAGKVVWAEVPIRPGSPHVTRRTGDVSKAEPEAEWLRRIEAVTDQALARLDVESLLDELFRRLTEFLEVDTAAVLLVDQDTNELVATAARGIEAEVRLGVRIPVGKGFAGTIVARVEPVVIEHVDETNVVNPILLERGIRSLLGAPLVASGRVIGVLHVGTLTPRSFDNADIRLLQMVADRVALAIDARQTNAERAAASALQHSYLPARLPAIPGLELAARYLPGEKGSVGGDWYDVFRLPDDRVGVVMGDVAGRGLAAALVMGRLRSALRAYAIESPDPADALERLDRKAQHFEAGEMTTVLYGVLELGTERMELSSAGHLLPILASPGTESVSVEAQVDPPLGTIRQVKRHRTAIEVPAGAALCLFTDGLVERRQVPLDENLDRLRKVVTASHPEVVCRSVLAALLDHQTNPDDVAVLAVRRIAQPASD
jgi:sigma-B regulation protein RsbU (phosphoserine phosphatase)